jgi:hypothetical protein
MFQLTNNEYNILRSQFVTANISFSKKRFLPYAFTEQGVSMLSTVLRSKKAIEVSIMIMDAFVSMRKFLSQNAEVFQRLDRVELKQIEQDKRIDTVFKALETEKPKQGIFYNGQVFDVLF